MLVGGTALAGYYAGHRRSDDIDLFTKNSMAFKSAHLAVKSLQTLGAVISQENHSEQYFHCLCILNAHQFTVDVVLDKNIFEVGQFHITQQQVAVADLSTLFKMKAATLVSRCSEKDLFDLEWLTKNFDELTISSLVAEGQQIDRGVTAENILVSLLSSNLRQEACGFVIDGNPKTQNDTYKNIVQFRDHLCKNLLAQIENEPAPELKALIQRARKMFR